MSATTRWWWIRHAPVINPDNALYGQSDMAADLSDERSFKTLAASLPQPAVWLASSLSRAYDTASELAGLVGGVGAISREAALCEQAFGDWEGKLRTAIGSDEQEAFWADPAHNRMPNGESFADLVERVRAAVDRLNAEHRGADIVAVVHAGTIRAALCHALGADPASGLCFQIEPLSLTRIDAIHSDSTVCWRVAALNTVNS
jgi:alpha-ribazole phosphatase